MTRGFPPSPPLLQARGLLGVPGLVHGLTTRVGGASEAPYRSLNLGLATADEPDRVQENRTRVARALDFDTFQTPYQVHGSAVVDAASLDGDRPRADAVVTDEPGRLIGVLGADCPGLLLVDVQRRALAVVHAGWRGFAAGVVRAAFEALEARYASQGADLRVFLGAAISGTHYEVDEPVLDAVGMQLQPGWKAPEAGIVSPTRPGHARLDLRQAIRHQLEMLGISPAQIECEESCTYADEERFFSHRRDGAMSGRHALVAGWLG